MFFSYFFRQVVEVEKQPKTIVIPRYQPIFVEPNMKEYETQVLQMSVPIDDSERFSDPKLKKKIHPANQLSTQNEKF